MISQDDLYRIVGLAVVLIFVISIAVKAFSYQTKILEGMTNSSIDKDKVSSSVTSNNDKIADTLLVSKYRSEYEDTIINLEKGVSTALLSEVIHNADNISSDPTSKKSVTAIENINNLKTFRETLNQAMIILDKTA
uniref:Uncharacterized protein n=1 Tax=viral metagenome TaxID=1070528 RepID=A0A6C0LHQ6_9ZZZZ